MSETKQLKRIGLEDRAKSFQEAYDGSYYTIVGSSGDLDEWISGYIRRLEESGIGKPKEWITFKGGDMNNHYGLTGSNAYSDGLTFLMFPLDDLDIEKLAIFRLRMQDKWFDDIVDNNEWRQEATNGR